MSQQINLFDPRLRTQKPQFSARAMVQALGAVLAVALVFQQLYAHQNRSLQATLSHMEKRTADLREQTVRFAKEFTAQGRSAVLADETVRVEAELRARRALLSSMQTAAGAHATGFSRYLLALARQTMDGVWLTGVEIGASGDLVLKGRVLESDLVPAYIRRLRREATFAGRPVHELRLAAKDASKREGTSLLPARYVEFSLSMPLGASEGPSKGAT